MARPQKFRLTPDEVLEPQHARKLAGHVSEIEFFRVEVEKLQAQIAGIYDAADEDGFDKKFVRKTVARRAKSEGEFEAEEMAVESYALAVEKGLATRTREGNAQSTTQNPSVPAGFDPETGEEIATPEITEQQSAPAARDLTSDLIPQGDSGQVASHTPEMATTFPIVAGDDLPADEPGANASKGVTGGESAATNITQLRAPKPFRPNCLNRDKCGGQGPVECWSCTKAASERKEASA